MRYEGEHWVKKAFVKWHSTYLSRWSVFKILQQEPINRIRVLLLSLLLLLLLLLLFYYHYHYYYYHHYYYYVMISNLNIRCDQCHRQ